MATGPFGDPGPIGSSEHFDGPGFFGGPWVAQGPRRLISSVARGPFDGVMNHLVDLGPFGARLVFGRGRGPMTSMGARLVFGGGAKRYDGPRCSAFGGAMARMPPPPATATAYRQYAESQGHEFNL